MENNNKLAKMNIIFDNETLRYRINGFAEACYMTELDLSRKRISDNIILKTRKLKRVVNAKGRIEYVPCTPEEEERRDLEKQTETIYYIVVNPSDYNKDFGNGVNISGFYEDLNFSFTNYFDKNDNLDEFKELPFSLTIYKKFNAETFCLEINTVKDNETIFTISKTDDLKTHIASEKISFYKNITNFSEVLKVIKSFVYCPEFIFINSSEIVKSRRVEFTTEELEKSLMNDENFDKPYTKTR